MHKTASKIASAVPSWIPRPASRRPRWFLVLIVGVSCSAASLSNSHAWRAEEGKCASVIEGMCATYKIWSVPRVAIKCGMY
ncbi:hypothetical protein B0H19DRAFT_117099 [Mycena capillaripes]|nr:hypothetical protein B0H19DRAFT_117099 [Mycena capillaripes]